MHKIMFWKGKDYEVCEHTLDVTFEEYLHLEEVRLRFLYSDRPETLKDYLWVLETKRNKTHFDPWFESECYEPLFASLQRKRLDHKINRLLE